MGSAAEWRQCGCYYGEDLEWTGIRGGQFLASFLLLVIFTGSLEGLPYLTGTGHEMRKQYGHGITWNTC